MSPPPVIETSQLVRCYREAGGERCVLKGVDLELAAGERLGLLGRSGSGKSTLLNLLGGIDLPNSGRIRIAGQDLVGLSERERTLFRRRHIGFIYQFFNLIPTLTVAENVTLPLELNGERARDTRGQVRHMLKRVGLNDRGGDFPDQLSGGEQQRVAIARAVVMSPALLLADEPTGNLDHTSGGEIVHLMEQMNQSGLTLLVVTHDPLIGERARRRIQLSDGRVVSDEQLRTA